jgi:uncharacterized protein (TIGR02996 family)
LCLQVPDGWLEFAWEEAVNTWFRRTPRARSLPGEERFRSRLLAAPHDDAQRLVYADWLDDRGDRARADFLRAQVRGAMSGWPQPLDPSWLAQIDLTRIEGCSQAACPGLWQALPPGEEAQVRSCSVCSRSVQHCKSVAQARGYLQRGQPVAVASSLRYREDDLA